jgi:hypothetical protein
MHGEPKKKISFFSTSLRLSTVFNAENCRKKHVFLVYGEKKIQMFAKYKLEIKYSCIFLSERSFSLCCDVA